MEGVQLTALGNPWILIPTGLLVIWDWLSPLIYLHWIKTGETRKAKWLLLFKPISTLVVIYFMFTQFGAGYFLGMMVWLLAPLAAFILFLVYFSRAGRFWKDPVGLLLIFSIAIPTLAFFPIRNACVQAEAGQARVLAGAMQAYRAEHGKDVWRLDDLVPNYLARLQEPSCNFLSGYRRSFQVRHCEGLDPAFFVEGVDGTGFELYDADGKHSYLYTSLDIQPNPRACP
jgi:hypothetical protein